MKDYETTGRFENKPNKIQNLWSFLDLRWLILHSMSSVNINLFEIQIQKMTDTITCTVAVD